MVKEIKEHYRGTVAFVDKKRMEVRINEETHPINNKLGPGAWFTGIAAIHLLCIRHNSKLVFLLGFDPQSSYLINNIYKGTPNYFPAEALAEVALSSDLHRKAFEELIKNHWKRKRFIKVGTDLSYQEFEDIISRPSLSPSSICL
jgi:hypothetical protein